MDCTKGEWLRTQLADLVKDVLEIERSDMPLLNKGIEVKCAIDTKLGKILNKKKAAPDMYGQLATGKEALLEALNALNGGQIDDARDYIKGVIAGNELALAPAKR